MRQRPYSLLAARALLNVAHLTPAPVLPQRAAMNHSLLWPDSVPARWRRVVALLVLLTVLAAAAGAIAATFVVSRFTAYVPLDDQQLKIVMPDQLPVQVELLADSTDAQPGVPVRLNERLKLEVAFDTMVPLKLTVNYRGAIPVRADIPINTTVRTRVLGVEMELPIEGSIPLDLSLPVDLAIPIDQSVRLKFTAPVTAQIDQLVHIPLRATLDAKVRFDDPRIPVTVEDTQLALPLRDLRLGGPGLPDVEK